MLDVVVLNRNLGALCDQLVEKLRLALGVTAHLVVVDSSTEASLVAKGATFWDQSAEVQEHGLRFARGMNRGLELLDEIGTLNPWVMLLPVDIDLVSYDLDRLERVLTTTPKLGALRPLSPDGPYRPRLIPPGLATAWNVGEGSWILKRELIDRLRGATLQRKVFDDSNFRGYLLSLELAFHTYANDFWVGVTDTVVVAEDESYLLNSADLLATEPLNVHNAMLLEEGLKWLHRKYAIRDPWKFAWIVKGMHDQFIHENPELAQYSQWSEKV